MIKFGFIILSCIALCWGYLEEFPKLDIEETCFGSKHVKIPKTMNDKFADLLAIAQGHTNKKTPKNHANVVIHDNISKDNPTLGELMNFKFRWHTTYLERFQYGLISKNEMYPENENTIKNMLKELATLPFTQIMEFPDTGDMILVAYYERDIRSYVRPARARRDEQSHPNHFYFNDFVFHNAEIAAYHLDRVLGFRRAIPHIGRRVNVMQEIYPVAEDDLLRTFFVSPVGNDCFTGRCEQYCDTNHASCGNPHIMEVSVAASLPENENATRDVFQHPWKRSYDKKRQATWEVDPNYCDKVRSAYPFNSGRRLLDLVDLSIMDFLTGNMNRPQYEMFKIFGADSFIIHSYFGRSFNRAYYDELSILAPLSQCCIIRSSTLKTLIKFHIGPKKLSAALRDSMSSDPLSPLLWEPHLEALDRRVAKILETVRNCVNKK